MKDAEFNELLLSMRKCEKCVYLDKKSLINIYKDNKFCTRIPSIWTDWFNRIDSKIMIIGQDWGPFNDMKKLNGLLKENKENWNELIETERSNTKKLLEYYIRKSSNSKYTLKDIFITNAIMCARSGNNYRGDNINLKLSTINCSTFLLKQIKILKPKVIVTLGYYPLLSLANSLNFNIDKTLKETIKNYPQIEVDNYVIIPAYHPVAQIKKEEQLKQYRRIWNYVD